MNPTGSAADPNPGFAEVDSATADPRRLEPDAGPRLRPQLPPPARDPPLDMAKTDDDARLAFKLLTDDVGIPVMPEKPLAKPILQSVKR